MSLVGKNADDGDVVKSTQSSSYPFRLRIEGINPTCTHRALEAAVRSAIRLGIDSSSLRRDVREVRDGDGVGNAINNRGARRRGRRMERGSMKDVAPSASTSTMTVGHDASPNVGAVEGNCDDDGNDKKVNYSKNKGDSFTIRFPTPRLWMMFPLGRAEVEVQSLDALYTAYGGLNVTHLDGNKLTAQIVRYAYSSDYETDSVKEGDTATTHHHHRHDTTTTNAIGFGTDVGVVEAVGGGPSKTPPLRPPPLTKYDTGAPPVVLLTGGGGRRGGGTSYCSRYNNNNSGTSSIPKNNRGVGGGGETRNISRRYRSRSPSPSSSFSSYSSDDVSSRSRKDGRSGSVRRRRRSRRSVSSSSSHTYSRDGSGGTEAKEGGRRRSKHRNRSPSSSSSSWNSSSFTYSFSSLTTTTSSTPVRSYSPSSSRSRSTTPPITTTSK